MSKAKRRRGAFREMGIVIALAVLFAIFTALDLSFISIYNVLDIIKHSTINGLLAIGITFAILTGGNDLSIGSIFAVVIVVTGKILVAGVCVAGRHRRAASDWSTARWWLLKLQPRLPGRHGYTGCGLRNRWLWFEIPGSSDDRGVFLRAQPSSSHYFAIIFIVLKHTPTVQWVVRRGTRPVGVNVTSTRSRLAWWASAPPRPAWSCWPDWAQAAHSYRAELDAIAAGHRRQPGGWQDTVRSFLGAIRCPLVGLSSRA